MLVPTHRAASLITAISMFPLLMLGGSFFPFEAMPSWMAQAGKFTPNGIVLEQLKNYFLDRAEPAAILSGFLLLLALGGVLFGIVSLQLKRFARGGAS